MAKEPQLTSVTMTPNVPCRVRDGTILRADVYRPEAAGRYPVLLCRTPYEKTSSLYISDAPAMAARGYIVVVQDVRGRCDSEGEFLWTFGFPGNEVEARDGYDSVEWAATLDGSNGKVGGWGNSYPSGLAWRHASTRPPSLGAIYTSGKAARHQEMCYGIFETGRRLQWVFTMAADARRRAGDPYGPYTRQAANDIWTRVERGKWLWRLPFESIPEEFSSALTPQFSTYYREVHLDVWNFPAILPKVNVPTITTTGWWDRLAGAVNLFTGVVETGPAALKDRHRLVIGPWGHSTEQWNANLGPRNYGPEAERLYPVEATRWFDYELKGIENGFERELPVKYFIVNDNVWRQDRTWPLEGTRYTDFFLTSGGRANGVAGDGALVAEPKPSEPDRYVYDPADPVMSLMGLDSQASPCNQEPLDRRKDVLVYQTPALTSDLLVVGPVVCHLWAASDAPDTDFAVKLIEVGADDMAINLTYGIVRARYRKGFHRVDFLESDVPQEFVITLMPVGIRFKKGSRIRLDIASADFPNFDRNHNTGRDYWSDPELRVARQTVFHDANRPSRIVLPVIPDR